MIQARPIPGFDANAVDESGLIPNGNHEEINLEARRRHRQEKLPPLGDSSSKQNVGEKHDSEKIMTVEESGVDKEGEVSVFNQRIV